MFSIISTFLRPASFLLHSFQTIPCRYQTPRFVDRNCPVLCWDAQHDVHGISATAIADNNGRRCRGEGARCFKKISSANPRHGVLSAARRFFYADSFETYGAWIDFRNDSVCAGDIFREMFSSARTLSMSSATLAHAFSFFSTKTIWYLSSLLPKQGGCAVLSKSWALCGLVSGCMSRETISGCGFVES